MIGHHYLLIVTSTLNLYILTIDYDSSELSVVSNTLFISYIQSLIVDQTDSRTFIAYNPGEFTIGNLVGNELVLSPRRIFNFHNFKWAKLVNNQLIGFRASDNRNNAGDWLWQFTEINLTTLTEKTTDVPLTSNNLYSFTQLIVSCLYLFLISTNFSFPFIAGLETNYTFLSLVKT
jgi:hypothetical protein